MKRYLVTGGVLALCFIAMTPAPADETFSRAVHCTFVMKGQIADNNRTLSSFQNDRSPDASHLRQWGMQVAQAMDQRYRSDLNRLSTYALTCARTDGCMDTSFLPY